MSSVVTEQKGDVTVCYFRDAKILDEAIIQSIGQELGQAADQAVAKKLVVNFRNVSFMSSAMIGKIILLNKKCKAADVKLKLCEISPNVMEVFKLMRLHKSLEIYNDEEKAVGSFEKKGWFG